MGRTKKFPQQAVTQSKVFAALPQNQGTTSVVPKRSHNQSGFSPCAPFLEPFRSVELFCSMNSGDTT
jgi:hypothetical protein